MWRSNLHDLIILGSGIHSLEMAEIVERVNRLNPTWRFLGYVHPDAGGEEERGGYPVLGGPEAIGRYADAVLLSVLRDVSRVPQVYEACERIRAVNIPLMGAVVNGVGMGKYRSYYRPYTADAEAAMA